MSERLHASTGELANANTCAIERADAAAATSPATPSTPTLGPAVIQAIDPKSLYWAVFEMPGFGGTPQRPALIVDRPTECDEAAALLIPEDTLALHFAYYAIGDGFVLAIGMNRAEVQRLHASSTLRAVPRAVPNIDPRLNKVLASELNLLVNEFEPVPLRRARRCLVVARTACILCLVAVVLLGLELRSVRALHTAETDAAATSKLISDAGLGTEQALQSELRRLRLGQRPSDGTPASKSPLSAMQAVLGAWPRGAQSPHVRTENLVVAPESVTLALTAESRADAATIIAALKLVPGWTLQQPQMLSVGPGGGSGAGGQSVQGEATRLNLRLNRNPDSATAAATEAKP